MWLTAPSLARPLETLVSGNFTFLYPAEEKRLAKYLAKTCEEIETRVKTDLGLNKLGPIEVTITASQEEFMAHQPQGRKAHKWVAALAYPSQGKILIKSPKLLVGGQPDFEKIFFHEVAHIALDQALRQAANSDRDRAGPEGVAFPTVPTWIHEGYAVFLSRDWSLNREVILSRAVLGNRIIPLGRLVGTFPEAEKQARLAYAESADLVHYLIRRFGREAFQQCLILIGRGHRFGYACRHVYGVEFLTLEKDWQKHLKMRYSWIPLLGSTATLWFLTAVIFLLAYVRKTLRSRATLSRWSEEEVE